MEKNTENRIENLEVLSMEQENTIEGLNREVHRQQLQIKALEEQIEWLKTRLTTLQKEEGIIDTEDDIPPPHY